jgi:PAS domain S-box-containing protein
VTTPSRAERLLLKFSPRLWQILLIIVIGLGALTVFSIRFADRLDDARSSQSDNTTWLISQLEVDALKLERAVTEARLPGGPSDLEPIRAAFDIYLSRVRVVSGNLMQATVLRPIGQSADWAQVQDTTVKLRLLIDVPDERLYQHLPEIADLMADMRRPMRAAVVNSLRHLIEAGTDSRNALAMLFNRSAVVATGLIALLFLTIWSTSTLTNSLRRRSHEAERNRSNLERTINASLDGVIVARADGRVQAVNPGAEAILGYGRDQLMASTAIVNLVLPEALHDQQTAMVREVLRAAPHGSIPEGRIELLAQRADGRVIPIELSLTRDRDSDDELIYIAFLRDISERRRYEASLREARDSALSAAETKSRFLAMMSHEMRTPLNGVIAALDILRETTRLTERQARFLGIAESSARTALEQIGDVLELARLEGDAPAERPTAVNLSQLLRGLAEQAMPLAVRRGNLIELQLPADDKAWVLAPRRTLLRVMINLVGNAVKFTAGGTIRITAELHPAGQGQTQARLSVGDTGIGIPADKVEAIFEPFETLDTGYDRETEGTGLGLGIARRSIERIGGAISVQSTLGEGSLFSITLPVSLPTQDEIAASRTEVVPVTAIAPPVPLLSVLIVEDNPVNRLVLSEMLRHLGQRVTEAEDGNAAIRAARLQRFDLIFMDISMPGLDGLATAAAIRADGASREASIVGLTAHGQPEELERFRQAGLAEVMIKPVTIAALVPRLAGVRAGQPPNADPSGELDMQVVQELCQLLDHPTREKMLASFMAEGEALLAALASDRDTGQLTARVHRLKGAAAVIGAADFARRLDACESQIAAGNRTALLDDLTDAWTNLRVLLGRHFVSTVHGASK